MYVRFYGRKGLGDAVAMAADGSCPADHQTSSNGWCYSSVADWQAHPMSGNGPNLAVFLARATASEQAYAKASNQPVFTPQGVYNPVTGATTAWVPGTTTPQASIAASTPTVAAPPGASLPQGSPPQPVSSYTASPVPFSISLPDLSTVALPSVLTDQAVSGIPNWMLLAAAAAALFLFRS